MSSISYENYGILAESLSDHTRVAGRYECQREAEKRILVDVVHKLALSPRDRLLEIGCGTGNLLIPLSFIVREVTGVDHPSCVSAFSKRFHADSITLIGMNFFDCQNDALGSFDKILIYSVLHYLSEDELILFVDKALSLLLPGGKMLLGDLPNVSRKERFLSSKEGKDFAAEWDKKMGQAGDKNNRTSVRQEDRDTVVFNDATMLSLLGHIRKEGFHAYILPQPGSLPFGHTREDILIERL